VVFSCQKLSDLSFVKMKREKLQLSSSSKTLLSNYLQEYCHQTSLHGWSLFGRSRSEKSSSILGIFWIFVFAISISFTIFFMSFVIQGENIMRSCNITIIWNTLLNVVKIFWPWSGQPPLNLDNFTQKTQFINFFPFGSKKNLVRSGQKISR